jgi:hypothetical protein
MTKLIKAEIWKAIPGYPNHEASNHGRIRGLDRMIKYERWGTDHKKLVRGRIYKQFFNQYNGYLVLAIDGKTKYVHRLVCLAFHQNKDEEPTVNHIDGDKLNNTPENLEWCSYRHNSKHAYRTGLMRTPRENGFMRTNQKLKNEDVVEIRASKSSNSMLAKKFSVTPQTIKCAREFKTYKNLCI